MALSALRRAVVALAAAVAVTGLAVPGALAHGGGALFEVLEAAEVAPGEVEVRVAIAHESDQHPAEGLAHGQVHGRAEADRRVEVQDAQVRVDPGQVLQGPTGHHDHAVDVRDRGPAGRPARHRERPRPARQT